MIENNFQPGVSLFLFFAASVIIVSTFTAAGDTFSRFDLNSAGTPSETVPRIKPWKIIELDPDYGGQWIVAGDLDSDGLPEIISSENYNENDVHYTTTAAAHKLDGSILWQWGDPGKGRKIWHHDVACQVYDWDGDGKKEVILCSQGSVVELDGRTGRLRRRISIPKSASDCLVFCNLTGSGHPSDLIVKNRYHQIWAYDYKGSLLWTVRDPGGYRTAHQCRPVDLDGDGRDEIFAGYAMLNSDGSVRWIYKSRTVNQGRGHLDCARIVSRGDSPGDFRFVLTCCGANNIAMIDGNGKILWELPGAHFESIDVGRIFPGSSGMNICVDIDHQPHGKSPIWILDETGNKLAQIVTDYSRHHILLDWTGDGLAEIIVGSNGAIYEHTGRCIAVLDTQLAESKKKGSQKFERSIMTGDFSGDGIADIMTASPDRVFIYKNLKGKTFRTPAPLGTELNFTLY